MSEPTAVENNSRKHAFRAEYQSVFDTLFVGNHGVRLSVSSKKENCISPLFFQMLSD
jgi:hypothetical protein